MSIFRGIVAAAILSIITPLCGLAAEPTTRPSAKPTAKAKPSPGQYWEKTIRRFELADQRQPVKPGMIVFVGSSSMRGWRTLQRDMAPLEVINRGFGGSVMANVVRYMDRIVINYKPRAVVVYEGDNDSIGKRALTAEQFMGLCKTFVKRLHAALPGTPVYFLSVKPSPSRWKIWPLASQYNTALKAWCDKTDSLTYIDIASPMLGKNGKPKADIFRADKLHMNPAGYKLWTATVRPVLMKDLHPKKPEPAPRPVYTGRVRIDAYSGRLFALTPGKASKGAEFTNVPGRKGAARKASLCFQIPVPAEQWRKVEFSFTPAASGNVSLELKGEYNGIADAWVYFDMVSVKGATLVNGDFEQGDESATGWRFICIGGAMVISDAARAHSGKRFIKVCYDVAAAQTLKVTKGQPVTVTAWARGLAGAKPIAQAKYIPGQPWERAIRRFELSDRRQPTKPGIVLFIGSSSMGGWHTIHRDMAPLQIVNRGFGGSVMADVVRYMDRIVLYRKPRAVVVYEGDNDSIYSRYTTEQFMAQCKTFVKRLHTAQPGTPVYFLSVKPSPKRWKIWPLASKYNAALKTWCDKTDNLTYIDIASPMLGEDGKPKTDIFQADKLHMNPEGYKLWTAAVRPVLLKDLYPKKPAADATARGAR